jgi:hypothetical protein
MSLPKKGRKDLAPLGNTLPPVSRFADAVAAALHRQYGDSHGGTKSVMHLTGVSERTAKNWFQAKNGPSGESLVRLCQHSDQVLDTVLLLAGRAKQLKVKKLGEIGTALKQMLALLAEIESQP